MSFAVTYAGTLRRRLFQLRHRRVHQRRARRRRAIDVHDWTARTGGVVLYCPRPRLPAIGDACTIKRGCPRNRPACMERGRILNYRGEPDLPGSDKILRSTIPGNANA
jgi:hypothetical protein